MDFMQILSQAGVPLILGTFTSGVFQHFKLASYLSFINTDDTVAQTWVNRFFLAVLALIVQIGFDLISKQPITGMIVRDLFVQYFAASVAYTHIIQPLQGSPSA